MKRFEVCCIQARGEDINEMKEAARDITRRTFLRHVDRIELRQLEVDLGYQLNGRHGLTMAADWAVSYHKSTYQGRPCVYFAWSAIEHVFTEAQ